MRTAHRVTAVTMLASLTLLTACTRTRDAQPPPGRRPAATTARLVRATGCDDLVARAREQLDAVAATDAAGSSAGDPSAPGSIRYAPESAPLTTVPSALPAGEQRSAGATATADATAGDGTGTGEGTGKMVAGKVVAGTNVQEAGVDEGDLVKTDGHVLVSAVDGTLRVTVLDDSPAVDGTLPLRADGVDPAPLDPVQLLLRGHEAVVVASDTGGPQPLGDAVRPGSSKPSTPVVPSGPRTRLLRIDLTDPIHPTVVDTAAVDGQVVATRMVDDRIRVVLRSGPWATPLRGGPGGGGGDAELRATDLLPRRFDGAGGSTPLGGCGDVYTVGAVPASTATSSATATVAGAADPARVTVLTVDRDLRDLAPVSVDGDVRTVYAATDALYLTTSAFDGRGSLTVVHRLALDRSGPAVYTGSGFAAGTLLDQYSMSERGGDLRLVTTTDGRARSGAEDGVATTATPPAAAPGEPGPGADVAPPLPSGGPAGRLTVLRPDARGTLVEVGHLDDLGVGERVQSVRFLDDLAYVVTFRTMDPLFAVDLKDPTAPRLLGELHVPGFSEYLHPVAPGRLLGIGTDADERTGATRGFRATLFDVTDPTRPTALDSFALPDGRSAVGDDPHAFTWDPVDHLAVVPVERDGFGCGGGTFCPNLSGPAGPDAATGGIASLTISVVGDHLQVRGTLVHDQDGRPVPIRRSVVVDRTLWTVSGAGLGRTPVSDPTTVDLLRY